MLPIMYYNIAWCFTLVLITDQIQHVSSVDYSSYYNGRKFATHKWQSHIKMSYDEVNSTLTVRFSHAPPQTHFKEYSVRLESGEDYETLETSLDVVQFRNVVCSGVYTVAVIPVDRFKGIKGKCLCFRTFGRCTPCSYSTDKITIERKDDRECQKDNKIKMIKKLPPPLPSVVTTLSQKNPRHTSPKTGAGDNGKQVWTKSHTRGSSSSGSSSHGSDHNPSYSNIPSTPKRPTFPSTEKQIQESKMKTQSLIWHVVVPTVTIGILLCCFFALYSREKLSDKKILFLYSHDHKHHLDVGKAMALYLQKFKCQVIYPPLFAEEEINQWLHQTIAECDYVLLLHSECIKRQSCAWANGLEYPQLRDNRNENFLMSILSMIEDCPLLQLYHSKYISCSLEHLSENYIVTEFPAVRNFTLPKDLRKLINYIHNIPMINFIRYMKFSLKSTGNSSLCMKVRQAAEKAAEYEKNKAWFSEKYSYVVPRCVINDQCGCRSSLNDKSDGTILDIPKVALPHHFRDDSASKQGIYVNDMHSMSDTSQISSELEKLNHRNDYQAKDQYNRLPSVCESGMTDCVSNWTDTTYASSGNSTNAVSL
ncbi:uncharacterized protein LOC115217418 [Argonauta hians]